MIGITPIGIYTDNVEASRHFYRNILGIEHVTAQAAVDIEAAPDKATTALMRLESPGIDVGVTETRVSGGRRRPFSMSTMHLTYRPREFNPTLLRLVGDHGFTVAPAVRGRTVVFADLNGITWEIEPPTRM